MSLVRFFLELVIVICVVVFVMYLLNRSHQRRPHHDDSPDRELNMTTISHPPLSFAMLGCSSKYSSDTGIEIDHTALVPRDGGRISNGELALRRVIAKLFPAEAVMYNVRPKEITNDATGRPLEFDVYLPGRRLAFEYNGQQHYQFGSKQYERDIQKADKTARAGIRLVEIPYKYRNDEQIEQYLRSIL